MFELIVRRRFSAAHQLLGYQGKCENLHGHTYAVEFFLRAPKLNDIGLALDFKEVKKICDDILDRYDHRLVNDIPPFDKLNPSAENMAQVFYDLMKPALPPGVSLHRVLVWESEDAGAAYSEE